jgi:hypothetical protein
MIDTHSTMNPANPHIDRMSRTELAREVKHVATPSGQIGATASIDISETNRAEVVIYFP